MSTSAITTNPAASTTLATTPANPKPANDPLANEQTFLKLLVSQLQNQNPLDPTDPTAFVSQLTSYSQLEQLIGINKNTAGNTTTSPEGTGK